jgi:hypothetical protein
VQTSSPNPETGYPGSVEVGYYSVQDSIVTMRDGDGKPTGKRQQLAAGEDPHRVAWRLKRDAYKARTPNFYRRLEYPRTGIV